MKKFIAVIIALCLCVGMVGCNREQEQQEQLPELKTEILGNWISVACDDTAVFHTDGTGELSINGSQSITWKYDPDSKSYVVTDTAARNVLFDIEEGIEHLSIDGADFYRPGDQQKAVTLMLAKRRADISKLISGMKKIKLDTTYILTENMTVTFTEITRQSRQDEEILVASYSVTNHRTEEMLEPICAEVGGKCYIAGQAKAMSINGLIEFAYPIEPGETVEGTIMLCELIDVVKPTIESFGSLIGVVHFGMYGTHYYLDLSEYIY